MVFLLHVVEIMPPASTTHAPPSRLPEGSKGKPPLVALRPSEVELHVRKHSGYFFLNSSATDDMKVAYQEARAITMKSSSLRSLHIILYSMLAGALPFYSGNLAALRKKVITG
ncbi:nuclear pore membrane glycoprotein 210-like [Aotus nancymaae]|uniref:nuclear pore membrane glycoprotein 210-like n=1 Tax=Aotus nancymaae TaxID=37293 RepID=UPI0030FE2D5F